MTVMMVKTILYYIISHYIIISYPITQINTCHSMTPSIKISIQQRHTHCRLCPCVTIAIGIGIAMVSTEGPIEVQHIPIAIAILDLHQVIKVFFVAQHQPVLLLFLLALILIQIVWM